MNSHRNGSVAKSTLHVYLLPSIDFETALALQRYLHYEITGNRSVAALVLCEHPPLITIGREGSWSHIVCDPEELQARQWRVRWVNRGGGCHLHCPGQLAAYPILPLDRLGLNVPAYLNRLEQIVLDVMRDFSLHGVTHDDHPGVWIGSRRVANIGIAVHDWVTYFGVYVNVNPALDPFRMIQNGDSDAEPMTSLERERRAPLSPAMVRQRFIEHFQEHLPFSDVAIFTDHPALKKLAQTAAVPSTIER